MRVDADDGAVDHEVLIIAGAMAQACQQRLPQAGARPGAEAGVDGLPRAEESRQIPPACAGAQNPKYRLDPQALIHTAPPAPRGPTQAIPVGLNF